MPQPGLEIDVLAQPPRKRSRKRLQTAIVVVVLCVLVGGLLIAMRRTIFSEHRSSAGRGVEEPDAPSHSPPPNEVEQVDTATDTAPDSDATFELVEDDGQTLWASPTAGPPLDLAFLPPGCQLFVALRPAELLQDPEGPKVLAALGPTGEWGVAAVEQATGVRLAAMEQLIIGLRADADGGWQASYVVRPTDDRAVELLIKQLPQAVTTRHAENEYWVRGGRAYFVGRSPSGPVVVVTPPEDMADVIDLAGSAPPLRRDMEQLVAASDADRHVTVLLAPNYLAADGKTFYAGVAGRLEEPLHWLFGDGLTAMAVSLDWGDDFFIELLAAATIDTRAHRLADQLAGRIAELPVRLEAHLLALDVQPYGRRLVARLPEMTRAAVRYTRYGFEDGHAVVRSYLPIAAGHNLLMAGELALVEPLRTAAAPMVAAPKQPRTVEERLAKITSLSFNWDTLEAALNMLAEDIGVEITINGRDLQADGITKNQSFKLDVQDRPAAEILVEILRLANPDKASSGTDDPRQKLVYVLVASESGRVEKVMVTTRAVAARRGDALPSVFELR